MKAEALSRQKYIIGGGFSMGWVTAAVAIAGLVAAAASAAGTVMSADAQRKASNYNADVADANARAAQDKAAYDEKMHKESVRKILASQRALYGKSGLSSEGSPLLVMEESTKAGEMDALAIRYGGDIAAAKERSSANLLRMQGKNIKTAGYIGAGSTLLAGASQAMSYGLRK